MSGSALFAAVRSRILIQFKMIFWIQKSGYSFASPSGVGSYVFVFFFS